MKKVLAFLMVAVLALAAFASSTPEWKISGKGHFDFKYQEELSMKDTFSGGAGLGFSVAKDGEKTGWKVTIDSSSVNNFKLDDSTFYAYHKANFSDTLSLKLTYGKHKVVESRVGMSAALTSKMNDLEFVVTPAMYVTDETTPTIGMDLKATANYMEKAIYAEFKAKALTEGATNMVLEAKLNSNVDKLVSMPVTLFVEGYYKTESNFATNTLKAKANIGYAFDGADRKVDFKNEVILNMEKDVDTKTTYKPELNLNYDALTFNNKFEMVMQKDVDTLLTYKPEVSYKFMEDYKVVVDAVVPVLLEKDAKAVYEIKPYVEADYELLTYKLYSEFKVNEEDAKPLFGFKVSFEM